MSRAVRFHLFFLASAFLLGNCSSTVHLKQVESSISQLYADDDSTLLGVYSKVLVKAPNRVPYFQDAVEQDVIELLNQKDANGQYLYHKGNGDTYDLYEDELKIYTTLNPTLQKHAEAAVRKHLSEDLQPAFTENNQTVKRFPFSDTYNGKKVSGATIQNIMNRARKHSSRWKNMESGGYSDDEIEISFNNPVEMSVFSWSGDIDTVMTPNDSIRYYKNIIRSGLVSIEPSTGHIKAWVGGIDYEHFKFDHVKQGKRQIGSCMKPFTYAAAFSMGVAEPCTVFNGDEYCVDPCDPAGRRWCPRGTPISPVKRSFAYNSSGGTSVSIMSLMGACSGPMTIAEQLKQMNITIPEDQIVPSMCLGTPDMSLFEVVAAYSTFLNEGTYITPQTIRRIEDKNGNVIYSSHPKSRNVYFTTIAYDVLQMMELVVQGGTSTSLKWHKKWGGITHPTAGKTGTTQGNADMWFFGITPDLVTGVWTGGEDKQVRFRSMTWGQGARASLPIYGYYMQQVYADSTLTISTEGFKPPANYDHSRFDCETISPQK
jgi:penicillin-binding protein 1A